jgi:hypothetical protein
MNIFTGNLISNSYYKGNVGKPILLHVFFLEAPHVLATKPKIIRLSMVFPEITVKNKVPRENIPAGTLFLIVISRGA